MCESPATGGQDQDEFSDMQTPECSGGLNEDDFIMGVFEEDGPVRTT